MLLLLTGPAMGQMGLPSFDAEPLGMDEPMSPMLFTREETFTEPDADGEVIPEGPPEPEDEAETAPRHKDPKVSMVQGELQKAKKAKRWATAKVKHFHALKKVEQGKALKAAAVEAKARVIARSREAAQQKAKSVAELAARTAGEAEVLAAKREAAANVAKGKGQKAATAHTAATADAAKKLQAVKVAKAKFAEATHAKEVVVESRINKARSAVSFGEAAKNAAILAQKIAANAAGIARKKEATTAAKVAKATKAKNKASANHGKAEGEVKGAQANRQSLHNRLDGEHKELTKLHKKEENSKKRLQWAAATLRAKASLVTKATSVSDAAKIGVVRANKVSQKAAKDAKGFTTEATALMKEALRKQASAMTSTSAITATKPRRSRAMFVTRPR